MKKRSKLIITFLTAFSIVTVPILTTSCSVSKTNFSFNGQSFTNEDELYNYVLTNTKKDEYQIKYADSWTMKNSEGGLSTYQNSLEIKQDIAKNIQPISAKISQDDYNKIISDSHYGSSDELLDNEYALFDTSNSDEIIIYEGNNDQYFYDGMSKNFSGEQLAKLSYMNENLVYYFNDIYFPDKSSLKWYLKNQYYVPDSNNDYLNNLNINKSVKSPNGNISVGIEYNNDGTIENENAIKTFINSNINEVFEYTQADGKKLYINKNDYQSLYNNISTQDIPYYSYYKNEGSSYIIDSAYDDTANFYGPYFFQGSQDIEGITNPSNWQKDASFNSNEMVKYSIYQQVSELFSLVFNDYSIMTGRLNIHNDTLFKIFGRESQIYSFERKIKEKNINLYNFLTEQLRNIEKGKRFNAFFKIPIIYSISKEYVLKYNIDHTLLDIIREYLIFVCDQYSEIINVILPENLTKNRLGNPIYGDKFDLKKIYGLNSPSFQYDGDMYYFVDVIIEYFPEVILGMVAYSSGYYNLNMFAGLIGFSNKSINYFIDILKNHFPKTLENFYVDNFNDYSLVYKRASASNINDLLETYDSKKYDLNHVYDVMYKIVLDNALYLIYMNDAILSKDVAVLNELSNSFGSYENSYEIAQESRSYKEFVDKMIEVSNTSLNDFDVYMDFLNSAQNKDENNLTYKLFQSFLKLSCNKYSMSENNYNYIYEIVEPSETFQIFSDIIEVSKVIVNDFIIPLLTIFYDLISSVPVIGDIASALSVNMQIFQIFFNMIMPTLSQQSYTFNTLDGKTKYMWDGGHVTSIIWGLIDFDTKDINSMKLITPIKYSEARKDDIIYFNNKIYGRDDIDLVKRDYINSLYVSESSSNLSNIKRYYTFDNIEVNKPKENLNDGSNNKETLLNQIFNKVKSKDPNYTTNIAFNYESGYYSANNQQQIDSNIEKIIAEIQPIKISMVPQLDINGYVDKNKRLEYKLPANSFDVETKKIISEVEKDIVGVDYIQTKNFDSGINSNVLDSHRKNFLDKIKVKSKKVLKSSLYKTDYYSNISENIIDVNIYKAKSYNGDIKYFVTEQQAYNWLVKVNNYQANIVTEDIQNYEIFGNKFNSLTEYKIWLEQNIIRGV